MSVIASVILATAAKVGAPIIGGILKNKIGGVGGDLAESIINTVAERLGVEPAAIPATASKELENAVRDIEAAAPELLPMWLAGLQGQFALLEAETKEGFWPSAWRWGWMYLLAIFWGWTIIVLPLVNQIFGSTIQGTELSVLLTLTSWFIALYMGGHTLKELGRNAIDAVKTWKRV